MLATTAIPINEGRLLCGAIPDLKVVPTYHAISVAFVAHVNVFEEVIIIVIRIVIDLAIFNIHV